MERPRASDVEDIFRPAAAALRRVRRVSARHEDICRPFVVLLASRFSSSSSSSRTRDPSAASFFPPPSILPGRFFISRSLGRYRRPFTKGTSGAWSILLMARTRVAVDFGNSRRIIARHTSIVVRRINVTPRLGGPTCKRQTRYEANFMIFDSSR